MIASKRGSFVAAVTAVCAVFLCIAAADGAWLKNVPDADRQRVNPFAGQKDAILAGNRIFVDHCAKCHGDDGTGRKKKPSLRTDRVQKAIGRGNFLAFEERESETRNAFLEFDAGADAVASGDIREESGN